MGSQRRKKIINEQEIPRILLLVETSHEFGRSLMRGVFEYSYLYGPFAIHVWPDGLNQSTFGIRELNVIGVIARISTPRMEQFLGQCGIPVVGISMSDEILAPGRPCASFVNIHDDPVEIGRKGAEYFLLNGFRHCAFVGDPFGSNWSRAREKAFVETIADAGLTPYIYPSQIQKKFNWEKDNAFLQSWLQQLPKPVGVLAAMDARGRHVIDVCLKTNIGVPEEVAVLGIDDDVLICELCIPTLSSIRLNSKLCGFQAAKAIHQMSQGKWNPRSGKSIPIVPLDIVERNSTNLQHCDDPLIKKAIRFIWLNSMNSIQVQDVVKHLDISRRTLEIRFKNALGHSVLQEISEVRCRQVQNLLIETDISVAEIAKLAGFSSDVNLRTFFLRMTGQRMKEFRDTKGKNPRTRPKGIRSSETGVLQ